MGYISKLKEKLAHYTWDLAYGEYSEDIIRNGLNFKKLHFVKNPYKRKWFADPFILRESDNELHVLVEEFDCEIRKGRIAHIVIDKSKDLITDCKIILDITTHLSFPAIYNKDGEIYVHPENYKSGKSTIYRYDEHNNCLVDPIVLLYEPIADAVIEKYSDSYQMSATLFPDLNGNELCIYCSNSFFGPYTLINKEQFPNNSARMAGMYLQLNNSRIRPAQDCFDEYGKAIIFYNEYNQIGRLNPFGYKYSGLHTFNIRDTTFIIDLKKRDYPGIYKFLSHIKHLL